MFCSAPVPLTYSFFSPFGTERELLIMLLFSHKQNYSTKRKSSWLTKEGSNFILCQFYDGICSILLSLPSALMFHHFHPHRSWFPCSIYKVHFILWLKKKKMHFTIRLLKSDRFWIWAHPLLYQLPAAWLNNLNLELGHSCLAQHTIHHSSH